MKKRAVVLTAIGFFLFLLLLALLRQPSNDRNWRPELALLAEIDREGDLLHISNIRNSTYRNEADFDLRYYNDTFNISTLQSVDFFVEPFSEWEGLAHTMLSFGFADGTHLVISIEARKEIGEEYSLSGGVTRKFELMYLFADERDAVFVRTNHRKHVVRMYPVNATQTQMQLLLLQMTEQANALRENPEFYNTLTDTCTSRLAKDVNAANPGAVSWSWKILLPGYADSLAYELGLINTTLSFEEAREFYRIEERAQIGGSEKFSERIRSGR
jgi:hypothetical protein